MSDVLFTRKFEQDGFTVIVDHVYDPTMECDTPEVASQNYDSDDADKAKYFAQDKARYDSWCNDDWRYIGISVTIRKQTASKWADGGLEVGRASIWGIESDSDAAYLATIEAETVSEAFGEVAALKLVLCTAVAA